MHNLERRCAVVVTLFAVLLAVLLGLVATPARAQNTSGKIIGQVSDPSGAVLPDVAVTATNTSTNVKTVGKTDRTGSFQILSLPIGGYTVEADKAGFAPTTSPEYRIEINQT